jgi:hypothetical protein
VCVCVCVCVCVYVCACACVRVRVRARELALSCKATMFLRKQECHALKKKVWFWQKNFSNRATPGSCRSTTFRRSAMVNGVRRPTRKVSACRCFSKRTARWPALTSELFCPTWLRSFSLTRAIFSFLFVPAVTITFNHQHQRQHPLTATAPLLFPASRTIPTIIATLRAHSISHRPSGACEPNQLIDDQCHAQIQFSQLHCVSCISHRAL